MCFFFFVSSIVGVFCGLLFAGLSEGFVLPTTVAVVPPPRSRQQQPRLWLDRRQRQGDNKQPPDVSTTNAIQSNVTLANGVTLEFALHTSIASIPSEAWNACLPTRRDVGLGSAFLDHSWLHCLEESKCASPQTGWVPQHVSIKINGETRGFIPLYIKSHSSKSVVAQSCNRQTQSSFSCLFVCLFSNISRAFLFFGSGRIYF